MTLLLEVPWLAIAPSGWPIFGLLAQGDSKQLEESSRIFMSLDGTTGSALGALTAVAGQAAADRPPQEKLQLVEQLQNGFRQAIGSALELDIALGTQWPLFGLIHFVLDQLSG